MSPSVGEKQSAVERNGNSFYVIIMKIVVRLT